MSGGGELGTVGTAFDYRVRYYYEELPDRPFAAYLGAARFAAQCPAPTKAGTKVVTSPGQAFASQAELDARVRMIVAFVSSLQALVGEIGPVGRRLSEAEEQRLDRYCLVLALLEQFYRVAWLDSPPFAMPERSLDELLALPSQAQVEDLARLSWRFYEEMTPAAGAAVCDPELDGKRVSGADADLLLGDCLVELKSGQRAALPACLRQLLAYTFLDAGDRLGIRSVGIYFARHACFVRFDLDDLVSDLISRKDRFVVREICDRSGLPLEANLATLRTQFRRRVPARM